MDQQHTRTGEAHDLADPGTHVCLITVDGAVGAGGLALLEGALIQSPEGIILQFLALAAQGVAAAVLLMAVEAEHGSQCTRFARDAVFGKLGGSHGGGYFNAYK